MKINCKPLQNDASPEGGELASGTEIEPSERVHDRHRRSVDDRPFAVQKVNKDTTAECNERAKSDVIARDRSAFGDSKDRVVNFRLVWNLVCINTLIEINKFFLTLT
jgi:hypothetical protein